MATSVETICNMALLHLGTGAAIDDINEASSEASACRVYYDQCLDELLAIADWPWATKYVSLGLVAEEPNGEWDFEYRIPVDSITVRRIIPAGGYTGASLPFERSLDASGGLIWTDVADAVMEYTARAVNVAYFPPLFTSALAWKIAENIAEPISANSDRAAYARQMAERSTMAALGVDGNATRQKDALVPAWIAVRGSIGDADYRGWRE